MSQKVLLSLLFISTVVVCTNGFCKREWDWKRKSVEERAKEADLVIYAGVVESPCLKPNPVVPVVKEVEVQKVENATVMQSNSTGNQTAGNLTQSTTEQPTTTIPPTTTAAPTVTLSRINCSAETYNVTLEVFCVIKGGAVPQFIHVDGVGIGDDNCLDEPSMNDTVHEYHAYHMKNYTLFLGRKEHQPEGANAFWLHTINDQSATSEVSVVAKSLMKVAGRHAHAPIGVWENKTHPACVPYSGASSLSFPSHVALMSSLAAILLGLFSSKSF